MAPPAAVLIVLALITIGTLGAVVILSPPVMSAKVEDVPLIDDLADNFPDDSKQQDSDSDGLSDIEETEIGTNPGSSDTDADGLPDGQEVQEKTDPAKEDSDGDGLLDKQEQDYGTDPLNRDTDGDGLDDPVEIERGTNPLDPNTDGDRYRDNEDPDPLTKNGAAIRIVASDLALQENYRVFEPGIEGDAVVATVIVNIVARNEGDDYSSFVKFDGVFMMDGLELKRVNKDIGRVDKASMIEKELTYVLKVSDLPANIIENMVKSIDESDLPMISFEIRNLSFEKF